MKRVLPVVALAILLVLPVTTFAYYDQAVLGTSIQISDSVFPPITAGPGHILPDSPFYFADKFYQQLRLALVFTPENRAALHAQIAQERLAELRVETMRNNQPAIDSALIELQHEAMASANDVRDASSQGKDVTQLARTIHQELADDRTILTTVATQIPDTAFAQKLTAASDVLRDARVISEDALPQTDIKHEVAANVTSEVDEAVLGVTTSTEKLQNRLNMYERYASNSASDGNTAKVRDQQIAALRRQITDLQAVLDHLLALQKQASKSAVGKTTTKSHVTPTITPKVTLHVSVTPPVHK